MLREMIEAIALTSYVVRRIDNTNITKIHCNIEYVYFKVLIIGLVLANTIKITRTHNCYL